MNNEYWLIHITIMYIISLNISVLVFDYVGGFIAMFIFMGGGCLLSLPFLMKYDKNLVRRGEGKE